MVFWYNDVLYIGPKIMSILETLHNTYSFRLFEDLRIINFYE